MTSNMAECFNGLLKGARGLPVTAIAAFTFYKCVAWFVNRHREASDMLKAHARWPPRPHGFITKANMQANEQEYHCFDHVTGTYEVVEGGGTTENGELREARKHKVVITSFTCTCGVPDKFHFPCSHMVTACRARNVDVETKIPRLFSVDALVRTWAPRFEPYRDESEWPLYSGPRYIADAGLRWHKRGSRKRSRYKMDMDRIPGRTKRGRANPFVEDPQETHCGMCGLMGHNSRTCQRRSTQVSSVRSREHNF